MHITELHQQRAQLIQEIADAQEAIKISESLRKISANPDFKLIIEKTYIEDESSRLVSLLADCSQFSERDEKDVQSQLYAVSHFRKFLSKVFTIKEQAESKIMSNQQELQEIDMQLEELANEVN